MFAQGTTTLEAKTGYGLDESTEHKMLQALLELAEEEAPDLVITYLGAHAVPLNLQGTRLNIPIISVMSCFQP